MTTIGVDVVCFDLPAPQAGQVAKAVGGELPDDGSGPVVIRLEVPARKPHVAARKAVEAVTAALDDVVGPGPHGALPIIREDG